MVFKKKKLYDFNIYNTFSIIHLHFLDFRGYYLIL